MVANCLHIPRLALRDGVLLRVAVSFCCFLFSCNRSGLLSTNGTDLSYCWISQYELALALSALRFLTALPFFLYAGHALLAFVRNATADESVLSDWNGSQLNPCRWTGIQCSENLQVLVM